MPGQFLELTVAGCGEAPFGFSSSPLEKDTIQLTIKRTGTLTDALHRLSEGDSVWLRGPFGNCFPIEAMEGRDMFFAAGGLGLAPLRPLIEYVIAPQNRSRFGRINMLFAARSGGDHVFTDDFDRWKSIRNVDLRLTIDREEEGWTGLVGFPHTLVESIPFSAENTAAALCGPPVMIKLLSAEFARLGVPAERIYTTLEMRMSCGVGKCGRCGIGRRYVCVDGPVFTMAQLASMPQEY